MDTFTLLQLTIWDIAYGNFQTCVFHSCLGSHVPSCLVHILLDLLALRVSSPRTFMPPTRSLWMPMHSNSHVPSCPPHILTFAPLPIPSGIIAQLSCVFLSSATHPHLFSPSASLTDMPWLSNIYPPRGVSSPPTSDHISHTLRGRGERR